MASTRLPVSIVCVFNDETVRASCLDASIERLRDHALDVDYIPIDNVDGRFSSAGRALNFGASQARNDYVAFVHQDVVLHSISALERAAGFLQSESFALLGACGITADARCIGRLRDRVILLGESTSRPVEVDSVDEVLFVIPRSLLRVEPLSTDPDLSWHGYAVEYGIRGRSLGLKVGAIDMPLTHNSLTTNLARLDEAHERIAELYPDQLPIRTTCGVIKSHSAHQLPMPELLARQRWRYRWLRESIVAAIAGGGLSTCRTVLGDIRVDIDRVLAETDSSLLIANLDGTNDFVESRPSPISLDRIGREIQVASMEFNAMRTLARSVNSRQTILFTNLTVAAVRVLGGDLRDRRHVIGIHSDTHHWILVDPPAGATERVWHHRSARPIPSPRVSRRRGSPTASGHVPLPSTV